MYIKDKLLLIVRIMLLQKLIFVIEFYDRYFDNIKQFFKSFKFINKCGTNNETTWYELIKSFAIGYCVLLFHRGLQSRTDLKLGSTTPKSLQLVLEVTDFTPRFRKLISFSLNFILFFFVRGVSIEETRTFPRFLSNCYFHRIRENNTPAW